MKRSLVILIVLAMVPLFMGLYCPCAMAEASALGGYAAAPAPCQGCCPEINAAPQIPGEVSSSKFTLQERTKTDFFQAQLKALSPGEGLDAVLSRRDNLPAAGEPPPDPSDSRQVLRI